MLPLKAKPSPKRTVAAPSLLRPKKSVRSPRPARAHMTPDSLCFGRPASSTIFSLVRALSMIIIVWLPGCNRHAVEYGAMLQLWQVRSLVGAALNLMRFLLLVASRTRRTHSGICRSRFLRTSRCTRRGLSCSCPPPLPTRDFVAAVSRESRARQRRADGDGQTIVVQQRHAVHWSSVASVGKRQNCLPSEL